MHGNVACCTPACLRGSWPEIGLKIIHYSSIGTIVYVSSNNEPELGMPHINTPQIAGPQNTAR